MKSAWIGSGFSHQRVPSLSKTATRSSGGTSSRGHALDEVEHCLPSSAPRSRMASELGHRLSARQYERGLELLDGLVDGEARRLLPRRELLERLEELGR